MNILSNKIAVFNLKDTSNILEYAKQINYDINKHNIFNFRMNVNESYLDKVELVKKKILKHFLECYKEYFDYYNISSHGYKDNLVFRKYVKDDNFFKHIDCYNENEISYVGIIFLNDDFVGGKLIFDDLKISYTPKKNDLIIFPCYIYHSVERLLFGTRYTIMYSTQLL